MKRSLSSPTSSRSSSADKRRWCWMSVKILQVNQHAGEIAQQQPSPLHFFLNTSILILPETRIIFCCSMGDVGRLIGWPMAARTGGGRFEPASGVVGRAVAAAAAAAADDDDVAARGGRRPCAPAAPAAPAPALDARDAEFSAAEGTRPATAAMLRSAAVAEKTLPMELLGERQ